MVNLYFILSRKSKYPSKKLPIHVVIINSLHAQLDDHSYSKFLHKVPLLPCKIK